MNNYFIDEITQKPLKIGSKYYIKCLKAKIQDNVDKKEIMQNIDYDTFYRSRNHYLFYQNHNFVVLTSYKQKNKFLSRVFVSRSKIFSQSPSCSIVSDQKGKSVGSILWDVDRLGRAVTTLGTGYCIYFLPAEKKQKRKNFPIPRPIGGVEIMAFLQPRVIEC